MAGGRDKESATLPGSARGGTSGQGAATPQARALWYLISVKGVFQDKPEKYTELLGALNALKDGSTNLAGLTARVKELFKDHHDLIPGFNSFLPKGYEIRLSPVEEAAMYLRIAQRTHHKVEQAKARFQFNIHAYNRLQRFSYQSDALCYLKKVKATFKDDEETYHELLSILRQFNCHGATLPELVSRWVDLLEGHPDLIEGLNTFLPEGYKITGDYSWSLGHDFVGTNSDKLLEMLGMHEIFSLTKLLDEYKTAAKVFEEAKVFLKGDPELIQGLILLLNEANEATTPPTQAVSKTPQSEKPQTQAVSKTPQSKKPPTTRAASKVPRAKSRKPK